MNESTARFALPPRPGAPRVPVSVNGVRYGVPWGEELEMPAAVLEALRNARYPVLEGAALDEALREEP